MMFLFYKYSDYDLDKSFLPQFKNNNDKLLDALRKWQMTKITKFSSQYDTTSVGILRLNYF